MARTATFQIIPGAKAPTGAPTLDSIGATNLRRVTPFPTEFLTLLDRMAVPLSAGLQELNFLTFTRLQDAGLLAKGANAGKFDTFRLEMGADDGMKYNWAKNAHDATIVGCTQSRSLGLVADGVDDYVDENYQPSTQAVLYTLNSASAFTWISGQSPAAASNNAIMARQGGTDLIRLSPGHGSSQSGGRINSTSTVAAGGGNSSNILGLFLVNRKSATDVDVYRNGTLVAASTSNTATALPDSELSLFRNGSQYYPGSALADGAGFGLSTQNITDLKTILTDHFANLAAVA